MPDSELTDWQYDLGGVVIGAGTSVTLVETAGLGRPPVRDNDVDQPSMDGMFAGPDYWAARQVQFDAYVKIPGVPAACHDMVAALQAATDTAAVRLVEEAMALGVDAQEARAMRSQRHCTLVFDEDARPLVRRAPDRTSEPA